MKTTTPDGYAILIQVHRDEDMGEPWKEHDGHGIVTEWMHRPADEATEWILCEERGTARFYDFAATRKIAKRDGWGLGEKEKAELKARLGVKRLSPERVLSEAIRRDFEYLRAWCNDEWYWLGYTTTIKTPAGETIRGDSCWGYDDEAYMIREATDAAGSTVEELRLTARETAIAECCP